jgi:cyclopropane-fatty-acyl-phospholipid synthase
VPVSPAAERVGSLVASLAERGAPVSVRLADGTELGPADARTRVVFRDPGAVAALVAGDHLALAEAFLAERIDVEGRLSDVIAVTDALDVRPDRLAALAFWLRLRLDRRRYDRASIAFHYDRPPEFFLSWLGPARCYTHGFYAGPDDDLAAAEARKLQWAIDALALQPGSRVLDVGCGWGSFLEYAGARGIAVHGLTLSREQHIYVSDRIRKQRLPCSVELVDFHDYRPASPLDAAVFMGSLEHLPRVGAVGRFLRRHLRADGRVYADFVTSREGRMSGRFLRKYVFPGVSHYVDVAALSRALRRAGFAIRTFEDDTASCAYTVRDWALRLEARRAELAARHGEASVRAFLLYLWGSHHFLLAGRTQAFHLVAARA